MSEIHTYWKYYGADGKLVEIECCNCGKKIKPGSAELLGCWTVKGCREQTERGVKIYKWYYCGNCA